MDKIFYTSAPFIMQHEITSRCNNQCGFCYNPERCQSAVPHADDRERNLEIARRSVERGVMAVCLTGGEPLLVGEHFWEVFDIYRSAGCYMSINSNGRLITDGVAKKLKEHGLNSALVSIHGVGEKHDEMVGDDGAYEETLAGILRLREHDVWVMPNFVATARNMFELRAVGEMLAKNGIKSMTATPFLPSFGADSHESYVLAIEHYQEYFEAIRYIRTLGITIDSTLPIPPCVLIRYFPETWREYLDVHSPRVCMAGKSFGVVSPDGFFRACVQAPYLEEFGGNLDEYAASWRRANNWANMRLIPDDCRDCAALSVCGGGCRTGCMWDNDGSVSGTTMYMGEPLTETEASAFIDRVTLGLSAPEDFDSYCFKFRDSTKIRIENGRTIIFSTATQSFAIFSGEIDTTRREYYFF